MILTNSPKIICVFLIKLIKMIEKVNAIKIAKLACPLNKLYIVVAKELFFNGNNADCLSKNGIDITIAKTIKTQNHFLLLMK